MKLKNYTTTVPADKTINEVQALLVQAGASSIACNYEHTKITTIFFKLKLGEREIPFQLPAKPDAVYQKLFAQLPPPIGVKNDSWRQARHDKAANIAWRIVFDWLKVQVSLIELEQAEPAQIFLPYMLMSATETLYDQFKSGKNQLGAGSN